MRPTPRSIHAASRSGLWGTRESATATSAVTSSTLQNSTAGPKVGPASQSTQRCAGSETTTSTFAPDAPTSTADGRNAAEMPRGSRQRTATRDAGGVSVTRSRPASSRAGWDCPFTATPSSSMPGGSVRACWPPRLVRKTSSRLTSVARSPGRTSSLPLSRVSVPPADALRAGDLDRHRLARPGQPVGWCESAGPVGWTGAMPPSWTCHIGPASRTQRSTQDAVEGAARDTAGRCSSVLRHDTLATPGGRFTATAPSLTGQVGGEHRLSREERNPQHHRAARRREPLHHGLHLPGQPEPEGPGDAGEGRERPWTERLSPALALQAA